MLDVSNMLANKYWYKLLFLSVTDTVILQWTCIVIGNSFHCIWSVCVFVVMFKWMWAADC